MALPKVNWIAKDKDNSWNAFEQKPLFKNGYWQEMCSDLKINIFSIELDISVENSLINIKDI